MKKLLLACLLASPFAVIGQKHHEIGVWAGSANYFGDLQTAMVPWGTENTRTYKPAGGLLYKYYVNPNLGFRFGASYMKLTAADSLSAVGANRLRNLSFTNNIFEVHGGIEVNLLPIDMDKFKVTPYIFAGVGAFYGNPFALDDEREKVQLRNLSTEGQGLPHYPEREVYPLVNATFPFGGGLKFFIGNTVMLTAEVGLRYAATDYLDDVSLSYPNLDTLLAFKGQKAVDMSYRGRRQYQWDGNYPEYEFQRGDEQKNDWYWTIGISATVYFDAFGNVKEYIQTKCPRIFGRR